MSPSDAAARIAEKFPSAITGENEFRGEKVLLGSMPRPSVRSAGSQKESLGFDYLVDISSVDHFGDEPRFGIVYELYSMGHGRTCG